MHIRPGKGVYVSSTHAWRFADQASLPDTYQMRFALEGFVARLGAHSIGDADIEWLEDNLAALQGAFADADLEEAAQFDFAFHMRIVVLAGNAAIESILRGSADIMKESQRLPYRRELVLSTFHEHAAIVEALKARDGERAGRAIEQHIVNAAQRVGVHFPVPHKA